MTSLLTSSCSSPHPVTIHPAGLRRSRAVRSKNHRSLVWFWFWVWFESGQNQLMFCCLGNCSVSPSTPTAARDDGTSSQDDANDDIMDRLVKSVTQNPSNRTASPKTRKRSRLNRKSSESRCSRVL